VPDCGWVTERVPRGVGNGSRTCPTRAVAGVVVKPQEVGPSGRARAGRSPRPRRGGFCCGPVARAGCAGPLEAVMTRPALRGGRPRRGSGRVVTAHKTVNAAVVCPAYVDDLPESTSYREIPQQPGALVPRPPDTTLGGVEPWMTTQVNTAPGRCSGVVDGRNSAAVRGWLNARSQAWREPNRPSWRIDPSADRPRSRRPTPPASSRWDSLIRGRDEGWHGDRRRDPRVTGRAS
jgi:hypothetical protein